MDIAALDAIDVHVHVEQDGHGCLSLDQELVDASAKYFKADQDRTPTVTSIAEHYRARRTAAVVFTVDATASSGHPALSSEEILDAAAEHADVLIPFGSGTRTPAGPRPRGSAGSPSAAPAASSSTPACRCSSRTTAYGATLLFLAAPKQRWGSTVRSSW